MKACLISFLLISGIASGQRPTAPVWGQSTVEFTTAKIAVQNMATKKYGEPYYKDATITIENANSQTLMKVTIDIPDKFFIKDGYVNLIKANIDDDGVDYYTYMFLDGDKLASISIYYQESSDEPSSIMVYAVDNYMAKVQKKFVFMLTEFK